MHVFKQKKYVPYLRCVSAVYILCLLPLPPCLPDIRRGTSTAVFLTGFSYAVFLFLCQYLLCTGSFSVCGLTVLVAWLTEQGSDSNRALEFLQCK